MTPTTRRSLAGRRVPGMLIFALTAMTVIACSADIDAAAVSSASVTPPSLLSTDVPTTTTPSPTAPPTVPHATDSSAVVIQLGRYDLGTNTPDFFVNGPEVVVYGDGEAYADLRTVRDEAVVHDLIHSRLDEVAIQALLAAATALDDVPPDTVIAVDAGPGFVRVGTRTWTLFDERPIASLLDDIRTAMRTHQVDRWVPTAWVARPYGAVSCTVTADDPLLAGYAAPVYPHVLDALAPGTAACPAVTG